MKSLGRCGRRLMGFGEGSTVFRGTAAFHLSGFAILADFAGMPVRHVAFGGVSPALTRGQDTPYAGAARSRSQHRATSA
jgi:hypothetical protein